MFDRTHHVEILFCWLALLFVCGEFSVAVVDLVHEGHVLAIYMAFNAVLRETRGGQHYHQLAIYGVFRISHWFGAQRKQLRQWWGNRTAASVAKPT